MFYFLKTLQKNPLLFLLIFHVSFCHSATDWKGELGEKISMSEKPQWMLDQINADLNCFKDGISMATISQLGVDYPRLNKVEIYCQQIYYNDRLIGKSESKNSIAKALYDLASITKLPDVTFYLSTNDSFYHDSSLQLCKGPFFTFAKRSLDHSAILFPDSAAFKGYTNELREVEMGNNLYPWEAKVDKAFWRGANSGFLSNSLEFMTENDFLNFPRSKLVDLSLKNDDLIDAGFWPLVHTTKTTNDALIRRGYVKSFVSISEHLRYKYQILVDGFTCAFHRAYWQLFSDSVIFKQQSPDYQWYYAELKPYVHYIPVAHDFSDLIEKIEWAKAHDDEARQIALQATEFAQTHLTYSDIMLYMYLVINEYAGLIRY